MKKISLFLLMVSGVVIWACNKTTTLPSYTAPTSFSVTSKMTHSKDSIINSGDTVIFSTQGYIADTTTVATTTHPTIFTMSATLKATDTTAAANPITILFLKKVSPAYDTAGISKTGLFHWSAKLKLPIPPVASKTGIKTTATFGYSLNLSSQLGNLVATDSKFVYVK
jgi:hypothetical protein